MYRSDDPVQDAINYIRDCDNVEVSTIEKCEFCLEYTNEPKYFFSEAKKRNILCCEICFNNGTELNELSDKYLKR